MIITKTEPQQYYTGEMFTALNVQEGTKVGPRQSLAKIEDYRKAFGLRSGILQSFGSDPEVFPVNSKGELLPAWEVAAALQKYKNQDPVSDASSGAVVLKVHNDGFALEATYTTIFSCIALNSNQIAETWGAMHKGMHAKAPLCNHLFRVTTQDLMEIPKEIIKAAPEETLQLGCMPSYNVYGQQPELPKGSSINWRTAGTHLHFGLTQPANNPQFIMQFVKMLDAIVGVTATALVGGVENPKRRTLYGRAGEFRTPSYGVEYRVLSSRIQQNSFGLNLLQELAREAATLTVMEADPQRILETPEDEITRVINESDHKAAQQIVQHAIMQGWWDPMMRRLSQKPAPDGWDRKEIVARFVALRKLYKQYSTPGPTVFLSQYSWSWGNWYNQMVQPEPIVGKLPVYGDK